MKTPVFVSRFMDQIDADKFAEDFLLLVCEAIANPEFCKLEWRNLHETDGRVGTLHCRGVLQACATVVRDQMNWSEVVCVSLVDPAKLSPQPIKPNRGAEVMIAKKLKHHFRWTFHNLVAHPLSEVLHLVGLSRLSAWIHDATIPHDDVNVERPIEEPTK